MQINRQEENACYLHHRRDEKILVLPKQKADHLTRREKNIKNTRRKNTQDSKKHETQCSRKQGFSFPDLHFPEIFEIVCGEVFFLLQRRSSEALCWWWVLSLLVLTFCFVPSQSLKSSWGLPISCSLVLNSRGHPMQPEATSDSIDALGSSRLLKTKTFLFINHLISVCVKYLVFCLFLVLGIEHRALHMLS